ncbi:LysR family transcriptional regulator [Vibrio quintilis]|nr:LysR family transcriptional regulator [Vibrio quintilis]
MYLSTIEQWFVLQTVIQAGGFTAAATQLHRSQSSVSYTISKLQEQLGVTLIEISGKKVRLTKTGTALLEDMRPLMEEFATIESKARALHAGAPAKIRLEVDSLYPKPLLFSALAEFQQQYPYTQVELKELLRLTTPDDARNCDLAIGLQYNRPLMKSRLLEIELIAVAHPEHPLHQLEKASLTEADINRYTQVYLDNNHERTSEVMELPRYRWIVNTIDAAIEAVRSKLCFGWLPKSMIEPQLTQGVLRPLPLDIGLVRSIPLFLIYTDYDRATDAIKTLAQLILKVSQASESQIDVSK